MRSFRALGFLTLLGAFALVGCGDDDGDGGTGGTGGTGGGNGGTGGGQGGSGGGQGGSGGGQGGSGGGQGGTGGTGPDVSPQATCTGCVELIVPVTGPNDNGGTTNLQDQVSWIFTFTPPVDMSNAVITWNVQAVEANENAFVQLFAQNGMDNAYAGIYPAGQALSAANFPAGQFRPLVLDLTQYAGVDGGDAGAPPADAGDGGALIDPGTFDKSQVAQIGITLGAGATLTGSDVLRIAVDSVEFEGVPGQADRTFTTGIEGLGINQYQVPTGTPTMPTHHP